MYNLAGSISISLLILITLLLALRWPAVSKILFAALAVRFLFLFINNYIFYLPDGDMDAKSFERFAWELYGQHGFDFVISTFHGPETYFLSKLIGVFYALFGRSMLMAQSISVLFGIASVFLGWLLAKKIWDNNTAIKVGWLIAFFPTLVSYSVLTMREVYISFFLLLAMYGIVNWVRHRSYKSIVIVIIGFVGATFFHGSSIIGLFVFLFLITLDSFKKTFKLLLMKRINLRIFIIIIFSLTILGAYVTDKISLPYIYNFNQSINPEYLKNDVINLKVKGTAAYPEWTKIDSNIEFLYKIPLRFVYFLFSPFPWDISKFSHIVGLLDSFFYIILAYLIFRNRGIIWKDPALKIILIILFSYFVIYGVGVGNFGSGIRHRSKFVIELILLAAPLIPQFIFFKKKIREIS